jgi:hypothetical protein
VGKGYREGVGAFDEIFLIRFTLFIDCVWISAIF